MATTGHYAGDKTTTTTTTSTRVVVTPKFDPTYVRTIPGILKLVQIVLDFIGFICIMIASFGPGPKGWFSFVSMTGLWVTFFLLMCYLFHMVERFYTLPWLLVEFIYCTTWTVFYLIGASVSAGNVQYDGAYGAAAFFGFLAMFAYGYDAYLKFTGWRAGNIAQGERQVTTSTVTSPTAY